MLSIKKSKCQFQIFFCFNQSELKCTHNIFVGHFKQTNKYDLSNSKKTIVNSILSYLRFFKGYNPQTALFRPTKICKDET